MESTNLRIRDGKDEYYIGEIGVSRLLRKIDQIYVKNTGDIRIHLFRNVSCKTFSKNRTRK